LFAARTNLAVAARPPRLAVEAGRLWQYLNTYRVPISRTRIPADPHLA
jgi:hypothetical protein